MAIREFVEATCDRCGVKRTVEKAGDSALLDGWGKFAVRVAEPSADRRQLLCPTCVAPALEAVFGIKGKAPKKKKGDEHDDAGKAAR